VSLKDVAEVVFAKWPAKVDTVSISWRKFSDTFVNVETFEVSEKLTSGCKIFYSINFDSF